MPSELTDSFKPDSTNILMVWYNYVTLELTVEFKGNRKYRISSIQPQTYEDFKSAGSAGKFYDNNIKDVYPAERIN